MCRISILQSYLSIWDIYLSVKWTTVYLATFLIHSSILSTSVTFSSEPLQIHSVNSTFIGDNWENSKFFPSLPRKYSLVCPLVSVESRVAALVTRNVFLRKKQENKKTNLIAFLLRLKGTYYYDQSDLLGILLAVQQSFAETLTRLNYCSFQTTKPTEFNQHTKKSINLIRAFYNTTVNFTLSEPLWDWTWFDH